MKIFNKIPAFLLTFLSAYSGISFSAAGTALSDTDKEEFIKRGIPSCVANQKKQPVGKFIDQADIDFYCTCAMTRSTDFLTVEDLGKIFKNKNFDHLKPILELTGSYCMKVVMKKWGMDFN